MESIGRPFSIQNTDIGWQVTWPDAVTSGSARDISERVSFTVVIPRHATLTIEEVQTYALKRAEQLLREAIRRMEGS